MTTTLAIGSKVEVLTGIRLYGHVGEVVALRPYPEHRNRPGQILATVEFRSGARSEFDARELAVR